MRGLCVRMGLQFSSGTRRQRLAIGSKQGWGGNVRRTAAHEMPNRVSRISPIDTPERRGPQTDGSAQQRTQSPAREKEERREQQCRNNREQERGLCVGLRSPERLMVIAIARSVFVRVVVCWIVKGRVVMLVLKEPTCGLQTRVKKARPPSEGHQRKDENAGTGKHDGAEWYDPRPNTQLYFTPKLAPPVMRVLSGDGMSAG